MMLGALIIFGVGVATGLMMSSPISTEETHKTYTYDEELPTQRAFKIPEKVDLNIREIDLWELRRSMK